MALSFFRDGKWIPEIIDDKLYLKHPDYNHTTGGAPENPSSERNKQRQITEEEDYRKMYQAFHQHSQT